MSFTMAAPAGRRPAPEPESALAPVVKTRFVQTRRGRECWGARTKPGGVWGMDRVEDRGTTWEVTHRPTKTVVAGFFGSLAECRRYVGSGKAQEDLEILQAHDRGEHEAGRDRECPACSAEEDDRG